MEQVEHGARRTTQPMRPRRWSALALALVVAAAAVVVVLAGCTSDDAGAGAGGPTGSTTSAPAPGTGSARTSVDGWEQVEDWPLGGRSQVSTAWTGEELVAFGGYEDTCPPNADCASIGPAFADGAALDLESGRWHPIADAPIAIASSSTAVVGGDVFAWIAQPASDPRIDPPEPVAFLRYDPDEDRWTEQPLPDLKVRWYTLVPAGDDLIASPGSDEGGSQAMWRYDPADQTWEELPDDPLPRLFDRSMAYDDGFAYLFGKELVPDPGSEAPSLQLGARLDLATGTWEELPTSPSIGYGMWAAGDGQLVNPSLASADGGEVGNWGRRYVEGATFDTSDLTWGELPAAPGDADDGRGIGFVGADTTWVWGRGGGLVLDVADDSWIEMAAPPGGTDVQRTMGSADRAVVALGGSRWTGREGPEPVTDVWIWRAPS